MEDLGQKIRRLRISKNLTLAQLAKKIGVSISAVSFWELNENEPKSSYLAALANYLDVSADYLLGLSNLEYDPCETLESHEKSSNLNLSTEEVEVLDYLRQLPQSEKDAVIDLARQQASKFGYKQQDKK